MAKMIPSLKRQIFVAYSYRLYSKRDYRKIFTELETAYNVRFIFADEKITNMHIMQKIISYIRDSDYGIFDISGWNPNVTLELGFAMALNDNWYIAIDPAKTEMKEVPSDLRGIDRIQYDSYSGLGEQLSALLDQLYPKRKEAGLDDYLNTKRAELIDVVRREQNGLTIVEISQLMGIEPTVAQLLVKPLLDKTLRTSGQKKGMRYHIVKRGPVKGTKYRKTSPQVQDGA